MIRKKRKIISKIKNTINKLSSKQIKIILFSFILLFVLIFSIGKTNILKSTISKFLNGLGIYTEEVKKVEIQSNDYDNPASWHIDKSAKWTGTNKAQVTFDVNSIMKIGEHYKDVVLVLDISGSMSGDKLEKVKSDSIELVEYLLSDSHNKVAIVTFDSTSSVLQTFTNDKNTVKEKIQSLTSTGCTNYNAALQNVDVVMNGYTKESNRDVVTLFLTDGYPNEDTPNQVGTFEVLKDKYPYMTVNGVQYEMGTDIIDEIKQITDSQWVANQSTLNNILFEASVSPIVYEDFIITDYIHDDYFKINSADDIKVSIGIVTLEEESGVQKIIWNLGKNSFMTGGTAKMTINLILKEQYVGSEGFYPTNKRETINYKLPEETEKSVNSTNTPVLKNNYEVLYDTNTPTGCTLPSIENENHFIYQNVTKKTNELSCEGYLFKGWEIDEEDAKDISKVNDDVFVMPEHDVHIRGTWAKQNIVKSMDGTVHEKATLYKVLQKEAKTGTYAKEYTGNHQDSMDASKSKQKIYYWYGSNDTNGTAILDKNNVLFANHCWQMIRTTDTGGVKMIYNGEAENNQCLNTRGTHVGYSTQYTAYLVNDYWYGTDYTYDNVSKTFKVSGEVEKATWNATTGPGLVGKYTCKQDSVDGTCSKLLFVRAYQSSDNAQVIELDTASDYSQLGKLNFNFSGSSPADVGYMYNTRYTYNPKSTTSTETMLTSSSLATSYWYAHGIEWGSTTESRYNLDNPYQVSSVDDYPNLVGEYTFRNDTQNYTNTSVYYIAAVNSTTMYYIQLQNSTNHNLTDYNYTYTYGDSFTDNGDGTYTINNPTTINRSNWYTSYSNVGAGKYVCKNAVNDTCSELWYTTATTNTNMTYIKVANKYKYSKGFTWDGSKYVLNNDTSITFWNIDDSTNKTSLNNAHYTCWNETGECTSISYIYYLSGTTLYYINLTDGKNVENALNEMLFDNEVNKYSSIVKIGIEAWYKHFMLDYDDYVEDTIFCNDRSILALNGWNPDAGNINETLQFKGYNKTESLSCNNITDRFSVSNNNAKLTYKVGLMSTPEIEILNNKNISKTGLSYWLGSSHRFDNYYSYNRRVNPGGWNDFLDSGNNTGVRPALSLIPGIEYSDGDGSMANPYKVELG